MTVQNKIRYATISIMPLGEQTQAEDAHCSNAGTERGGEGGKEGRAIARGMRRPIRMRASDQLLVIN